MTGEEIAVMLIVGLFIIGSFVMIHLINKKNK